MNVEALNDKPGLSISGLINGYIGSELASYLSQAEGVSFSSALEQAAVWSEQTGYYPDSGHVLLPRATRIR